MELISTFAVPLNSECQTLDWPCHKQICGKNLSIETARSTAIPFSKPPSTFKIGPPIGGFERSPALTAQIHGLAKNPGADYILFSSTGTSHNVVLPTNLKALFRQARNDAFTTGNAKSVACIAQYLVRRAARLGTSLSASDIMTQLRREFEFDVARVVDALEELMQPDSRSRGLSQLEVDSEEGAP